jgi:hypothetical protein
MTNNLLKKIVVGGLIVGAGLGLSSCQKYEINGHKVVYNLFTSGITESYGNNKIRYIISSDNIHSLAEVIVNGHNYTDGPVFHEAERNFNSIKDEIYSRKKVKAPKKNKEYMEEDLEVLKGMEIK